MSVSRFWRSAKGQLRRLSGGHVLVYGIWKKLGAKLYSKLYKDNCNNYVSHSASENIRFRLIYKLKKEYKRKLPKYKTEIDKMQLEQIQSNTIWILWWQGLENAPEIVKACYFSIKHYLGKEYNIVLLTKDNYTQYIQLPKDVTDKIMSAKFSLEKGKIPLQFFSDLIRLELLNKYGGIWLDATVFCTSERIPKFIQDVDAFYYQVLFPSTWTTSTTFESWFIAAKSNQKHLILLQKLMCDYVTNHTVCPDYLLIFCLMELVKEAYPDECNRVPPVSNTNALCLQNYLFDEFDEKIYKAILSNSVFHKLTWKFEKDKSNKDNTYYRFILEAAKTFREEDEQDVQK